MLFQPMRHSNTRHLSITPLVTQRLMECRPKAITTHNPHLTVEHGSMNASTA
jgi:hypothetical protein